MPVDSNTLAVSNVAGIENAQFSPDSEVVPSKTLVIASFDPAKTLVVPDVPKRVFSGDEVGDESGFGFAAQRLVEKTLLASGGIECWVVYQDEDGSAVQSTGDIDFASSTGVKAGTLELNIAGDVIPVAIATDDSADDIATKVVAELAKTKHKKVMVTAAVNGTTTSQVDFTAKSAGPFGDDITLGFNRAGGTAPTGVSYVVTDMASGTGLPDISTALASLGQNDLANKEQFTEVVHGNGQDSTTLDAISVYVGEGDTFAGVYKKAVAKPFYFATGDTGTGSSALTALLALGNGRKLDRGNAVIALDGSISHPAELAAAAIGLTAAIGNVRPPESYEGLVLPEIWPGEANDAWTNLGDSRDDAVHAGISPCIEVNGAAVLQNVVTFYHPDNVSDKSNAYRDVVSVKKHLNILRNSIDRFASEKWTGVFFVDDKNEVTDPIAAVKARDRNDVVNELISLATEFAAKGWLFNSAFTIAKLQSDPSNVVMRAGGTGVDWKLPSVYSGIGGISNGTILVDTNTAAAS